MASYAMLSEVVDVCPEKFWYGTTESDALWKRVLHTLESVDYWINRKNEYRFKRRFHGFSAEMDVMNPHALSHELIKKYMATLKDDIQKTFNELDDEKLLQNSRHHQNVKVADIILTQIRHIQTNVGYCNEVLRGGGSAGVPWVESGL